MYVDNLTLKNFRNYNDLTITFSPDVNFITGNNGIGKSNILEAISVLSNLKSFRNVQDSEIIQWGSGSYYCSCLLKESKNVKFEIGYIADGHRIKKKVKIDNNEIKNASDYYGNILTVIFSPIDIDIINGGPDLRRRFIDSVISKVDSGYFKTLTDFRKVLYSRNRLLKRIGKKEDDPKELEVWDQLFAQHASIIVGVRNKFVENLKTYFHSAYSNIAEENEAPSLVYCPSLEDFDTGAILNTLNKMRKRDFLLGSTGIGPQRDDYKLVNTRGKNFLNYASQGQKRTAAIALKISESEIIESISGEKSIILVDDIFSELDDIRRKNLFYFLRRENQVIFTMVHSNSVDLGEFRDYKHFSIESEGNIITK
jgi:DNA replication and repair protein RecF